MPHADFGVMVPKCLACNNFGTKEFDLNKCKEMKRGCTGKIISSGIWPIVALPRGANGLSPTNLGAKEKRKQDQAAWCSDPEGPRVSDCANRKKGGKIGARLGFDLASPR